MDSFHQCKTKPASTAPAQPELPSPYLSDHQHKFWCTTDEQQCDGACKREHVCSVCHKKRKDCPEFELTLLEVRERQLLAALRENQQLRRQVAQLTDSRNCAPERTKNLRKRAETAEQQLAQKDARIAELEGGK
jgi:hypothetical protein